MPMNQPGHVGGNLFSPRPLPIDDHEDEYFLELLSRPRFSLERIISTGQTTPPSEWLEQTRAEWVVLLTGQATLRFAASDPEHAEVVLDMKPGDYVEIPPHCRHRVDATSPTEPSVWLALHFDEDV